MADGEGGCGVGGEGGEMNIGTKVMKHGVVHKHAGVSPHCPECKTKLGWLGRRMQIRMYGQETWEVLQCDMCGCGYCVGDLDAAEEYYRKCASDSDFNKQWGEDVHNADVNLAEKDAR